MEEKIVQEILDELVPSLEALETQSAALLQFIKSKKLASPEDLAPFVQQATNASTVRWRAVRLRMERLLSSAAKAEETEAKKRSEESQTRQENQEKDDNSIRHDQQKSREPTQKAQSVEGNEKPPRQASDDGTRQPETKNLSQDTKTKSEPKS